MRSMPFVSLCCAVLLACGALQAASATPEELKKQTDFKKAFGASQTPKEQLDALALLDGAEHPTTWNVLATVVRAVPDKDVRIEAFTRLTKMPARDPKLSALLAQLFSEIKPSDKHESEIKQKFTEAMANSEFRYVLGGVLTDYCARSMRYPDYVTPTNATAQQAANAREFVDKQRNELEAFLGAYNKLFDSDIKEPNKNTPADLRKWWAASGAMKIGKADKELADKYAAEDKEKAKAAK